MFLWLLLRVATGTSRLEPHGGGLRSFQQRGAQLLENRAAKTRLTATSRAFNPAYRRTLMLISKSPGLQT
jgi:hypothetical protein